MTIVEEHLALREATQRLLAASTAHVHALATHRPTLAVRAEYRAAQAAARSALGEPPLAAGDVVDWSVYGAGAPPGRLVGVVRCKVEYAGVELGLVPLDWVEAARVLAADLTAAEVGELVLGGVLHNQQPEHCALVKAGS